MKYEQFEIGDKVVWNVDRSVKVVKDNIESYLINDYGNGPFLVVETRNYTDSPEFHYHNQSVYIVAHGQIEPFTGAYFTKHITPDR